MWQCKAVDLSAQWVHIPNIKINLSVSKSSHRQKTLANRASIVLVNLLVHRNYV